MSIEEKIEDLKNEIEKHQYNYYVLSDPTISDYEFDLILKELEKLESENPHLIVPDSPTQRVGREIVKDSKQIPHKIPMLSLSNTYSFSELEEFDKKNKEALGTGSEIEYVVEYKIDGASVNIHYTSGKLEYASTRGDGLVGEEITHNIKTIKSIPLKLKNYNTFKSFLHSIDIRGEAYMELSDFSNLNIEREKAGEKLFANPRNATSGTLKLQDPTIVSKRPLRVFVYNLISDSDKIETHFDTLNTLKELGFPINPYSKLCKNIKDVEAYCNKLEEMRDTLPYEVDGAVIKVNNINFQKEIGYIAKAPKWAVAYKFKAKQTTTIIREITWQVGRTGAITPVAELVPVFLAGSTISRATLHNIEEIRRKDIRVNDKVFIEKGGDVIPKVVSVILSERQIDSLETTPPEKCPVCNSALFNPENEVSIYCSNYSCPAQIKGRIEHFSSRTAMNIDGLGEAVIDLLVNNGFINNIADLYQLSIRRDELIKIERYGEKSIDNMLSAIENSKSNPFHKVLYAIGIRYVGATVARKLAEHFKSIDSLKNASEEELNSVYEIGPSISKSIINYFSDKNNLEIISRLKTAGINFEEINSLNNGQLNRNSLILDKTFVLTGTLESMTREKAKELIMKNGGKVVSSVSKNTNYVLSGSSPGSKLTKAQELNVTILSEMEFLSLIGGEN